MNRKFVLDASPLIFLGKIALLKTISPLANEWTVPEGVVTEVESKSPVHTYLSDLSESAEISRVQVKHTHPSVAKWDLGQGESEVITLGMENPCRRAVLDDLQARKCAALLQVPLTGSLGLLVMAKKEGYIHLVRPEVEKLVQMGLHIDADTLYEVYKAIGE